MAAGTATFGWTRTSFGLAYFSDSGANGVAVSQAKVDADCGSTQFSASATTLESTYQTDKTSLTGADAALKMTYTDNKVTPSVATGGV